MIAWMRLPVASVTTPVGKALLLLRGKQTVAEAHVGERSADWGRAEVKSRTEDSATAWKGPLAVLPSESPSLRPQSLCRAAKAASWPASPQSM
jgi:hypothetical protein